MLVRGRHRRRVLSVLVVCIVSLAACTSSGPVAIALETLAMQQEDWDGRLVRARGTVHSFDEPLHVWIEDDAVNRVELRPLDGIVELVGQTVEVVGRFSFEEGEGRWIEVDALDVVGRQRP